MCTLIIGRKGMFYVFDAKYNKLMWLLLSETVIFKYHNIMYVYQTNRSVISEIITRTVPEARLLNNFRYHMTYEIDNSNLNRL